MGYRSHHDRTIKWNRIKALAAQGMSTYRISKLTGCAYETVNKYLQSPVPPHPVVQHDRRPGRKATILPPVQFDEATQTRVDQLRKQLVTAFMTGDQKKWAVSCVQLQIILSTENKSDGRRRYKRVLPVEEYINNRLAKCGRSTPNRIGQ